MTIIGLLILGALNCVPLLYAARQNRRSRAPALVAALLYPIAAPLLSDNNAMRVDPIVHIIGAGRLLTHLSIMGICLCHYLIVSTITDRRPAHRQRTVTLTLAFVGLFIVLWVAVHTVQVAHPAALYYGLRGGHPAVLWLMNVVMGGGLTYISLCLVREYTRMALLARKPIDRLMGRTASLIFIGAAVSGLLTVMEATARASDVDPTLIHAAKAPLAIGLIGLSGIVLAFHVYVWPLWTNRKALLLRYVQPEHVRLRNELVELLIQVDERRLDMHPEAHANRSIVRDVDERCRTRGLEPAHRKVVVEATRLITFNRSNVLNEPDYVDADSWSDLDYGTRTQVDQRIAATAWEQAKRDIYFLSDVSLVCALVLGPDDMRETYAREALAWHHEVAEIIAVVMGEHGQSTALMVRMQHEGMAIRGKRTPRRRIVSFTR